MKFKLREEVKGNFESEEAFWAALKQGWEVEKEHAGSVGNNPVTVTKIVLDHLGEDIAYYTKLKKLGEPEQPKEEANSEKKETVNTDGDDDEDEGEEQVENEEEDKQPTLKV